MIEFEGAINLVDWWNDPFTDQPHRSVVGHVSILGEADIGFKLRTVGNANYLVRVEGPTGEKVDFPGCKVFGFIEWGDGMNEQDHWPDNVYEVR